MSIGHTPDSDPYTPDMKKDESDITHEERAEAQRRIQGSILPDSDGDHLPGSTGHDIS